MGRFYHLIATPTGVTIAKDLLFIKAADNRGFRIHELHITQSTEAGDAQSEQLTVRIRRITGTVTDGSGGSAVTLTPVIPEDIASVLTSRGFDTTATTSGTAVTLARRAYNVMAGWEFVFPVQPLHFSAGNGASAESICVVDLIQAPADSITFEIEGLIEEF
jgi:hypothetical protein